MTLDAMRDVLVAMEPTGSDGFEGLAALALNAATNLHFRLTKSGSQQGTDGAGAGPADGIGFECKRYDSKVESSTVKVKLLDLQTRNDVELWVLCATCPVDERIVRSVRQHADLFGLQTQVFDWDDTGANPLLALLLSFILPATLDAFLAKAGVSQADIDGMRTALAGLRAQPGYLAERQELLSGLDVVNLGFAAARRANAEWFVQTLSDREAAIDHLRQPLAPLDESIPRRIVRTALVDTVQAHMQGPAPTDALFLIGEEGAGKSWLPLDAWLELPPDERPMLLVIQSRDLAAVGDGFDLVQLLATTLARQTLRHGNGMTPDNWGRMVRRWVDTKPYRSLPLVVVVDGINQHEADWGRITRRLFRELRERNARLVVSSRQGVFEDVVRPRFTEVSTCAVPVWTEAERNEILTAAGLAADSLKPSVAASLRNPRMLSIALELLDANALQSMDELTKAQLLFEYLRRARRDYAEDENAPAFMRRLTGLAKTLLAATTPIERRRAGILDDVTATAEGRFFAPLADDPTRYTLSPEGLTLALGLAVVDHVREAIHGGISPTAAIAALVEPISTMDDTADVLIAAAWAANLSRGNSRLNIVAGIITAFVGLQNVDPVHAPGFQAFARECPDAVVLAAETIWLAPGQLPENGEWVQSALSAIPSSSPAWTMVAAAITRWLSFHALAPVHVESGSSSQDEQSHERRVQRYRGRLEKLTEHEKELLVGMQKCEGDVDALAGLSLELLAGRALESFVPALARWALSRRLAQSSRSPNSAFSWLGNHNAVDWPTTRDAVRGWCNDMLTLGHSDTGTAAVVQMYRFTGDSQDGRIAMHLLDKMRANDPEYAQIRALNAMQSPEPADPASLDPDDITTRIEQFESIDVTTLFNHFGTTSEDHDFERALPWVARIQPTTAIAKVQAFIDQVPSRDGMALRQGIFAIEAFSLAMSPGRADALLDVRSALLTDKAQSLSEREREVMGGYCLLLALPQLDGDAQLNALLRPAPEQAVWIQHTRQFKDATAPGIEQAARQALASGNPVVGRYILGHLAASDDPVTPAVDELVLKMVASDEPNDRVSAFAFLQQRGLDDALVAFVEGNWSSATAANDTEAYFGSLVLVRAVKQGLASPAAVSPRITPEAYGAFALANAEAAAIVGGFLQVFLHAMESNVLPSPTVDLEVQLGGPLVLRDFIDVEEREIPDDDGFGRINWTPADYAEKAKREHEALMAFCEALTRVDAALALRALRPEGMHAAFAASASLLEGWTDQLLRMPLSGQRAVANIALMFAGYLAQVSPGRARMLFDAYAEVKPYVSLVFDMAAYPLASQVAWQAAGTSTFADLCGKRLDGAKNDAALAREVVAAQSEGRTDVLLAWVDTSLATGLPARAARAFAVLGFMDASPDVDVRLASGSSMGGLPGAAWKHATRAFQANAWARHWFEALLAAPTDAEAWPFLVHLEECADARYDLWSSDLAGHAAHIHRLGTSVLGAVRKRAGKTAHEREKTLFGEPRPDEVFLASTLR
ncbi:hypothetical protein [Luteibacter aegosomatissinici]|uniref:hypothetical protein n=1 Tax=Luteibacter aegosomatissinici TaxID=2911539 RepID=UPI001FF8949E|nr:hypothetical protein [Luteibacter aegosomatissinici]UPG92697.1 hypothetical protein L2Y97_12555 [Luteibacter aegosomatissinici]